MKAVLVENYGGVENLRYADVPTPDPNDGEALVRQTHAGVNFIDIYMRNGLYRRSDTYAQSPPMVIGMEGGGVIEAVGPGVSNLKPGQRVAYCIDLGSYAEYATVPAWKLVPVPDDIPDDIATALMLQGATAHYMTHTLFPLQAGQSCLIHAGAGGVGQLMIQLAKVRGATVFATVGSPEKADIARARGADHVILYREQDFLDIVKERTHGEGVNVVYDSVGKDTIDRSIRSLKRRGTCVNYGAASGAVTAVSPLELAEAGSVFFTRPHLADYISTAEERRSRAEDLFQLVREKRLTVTLDRTFPLADAANAHQAMENRETRGKLLLKIAN